MECGIFTWLICESYDDKGNAVVYEYAAENSATIDLSQANERNRTDTSRSANRYLKRIKYGNTPSRLVQPDLTQQSWMFEVVFDYGEGHYAAQPPDAQGREFVTASPIGSQPWPVRLDPFSGYRACFEVRAYRLCRRMLMFHHFPNELGVQDDLVRATEFTYNETPIASFITAVTQSGFMRQSDGTSLKRSLPTLEFAYSEAQVQRDVHDVDPESLANLPSSVDGLRYHWVDLDGEGLQCVLAELEDGWYYKRNLSPLTFDDAGGQPTASARFEPVTEVTRLPAFAAAKAPRHQFLDLAGDGQLDCVMLERPVAGFYKRTDEEDWDAFTPLASAPNVDWNDPNLRFIDLDGDGHADILITEHEVLTWYPSLAEAGFGAPIRVPKARDEEEGPALIFADGTQSIFLADMSGDRLTDLVRIRNGEVCYWPNLGYGQFGRKVTMDRAPWFETPDLFDQRRIRLADIDGSGTMDLIYLASDGVQLYFNQSGNTWSDPEKVAAFPSVDYLATVQALDLLGNGTACLVWTSSLPGDARHSMRYVDLMGGEKPHLLVRSRNNLGAETRVFYAPSTKFYLTDREAGNPWVTRLPFPVQVVERVETYDWISRNRFVSRYAYHHGYYDGIEREFRGFGMVEQQDTEELGALSQSGAFPDATNIDAASYVPPVLTKTWFHTGAYPQGPRVSRVFDQAYYRESDVAEGVAGLTEAEFEAMRLPDTVLPAALTGDEVREAIRSLKGGMLRQEVYALDGTDAADRPYSVSEKNYGSVAKLLFREFGSLQVIEFLAPDFWILPKNQTLRQNLQESDDSSTLVCVTSFPCEESRMTTVDFITALFYEVDEQIGAIPKHPAAHLWPSEVITLGLLHALKGGGNRAFYRWLTHDYRPLFPRLPERTRLFRLFTTHQDWTQAFLAAPTVLGVIDTYGIELIHPIREGRSPQQIGRKGVSNHRWIVGGKLCLLLNQWGLIVAWECATANVADNTFQWLIRQFEEQMIVLSDTAFHAAEGDPNNLKLCQRGEWEDRMLVETVFSMLTLVSHFKKVMHRGWAYFQARLAFTMAAFNVLVQWYGLQPNASGFVPLSIAEFSL